MELILRPRRSFGVDEEVRVGKEIVAGNRTIWPVVRITIFWASENRVHAIQITPLAALIIEQNEQYALSFDGGPMTIDVLLELMPSLRDILEQAKKDLSRKGSRIVVL
ncbi:MAG: hypothetical protein LUQ59_07600 [Methanothrix sp.]|nr:hypothetical protein [Methanothrix sp.]